MRKSTSSHSRFDHRPSIAFTRQSLMPLQKKTEPASEEKVLQLEDFKYVIKGGSGRKQSANNPNTYKGGDSKHNVPENDRLSKALKKERFGLEILSLECILGGELTHEYLECIYFTSIYTINNYFGTSGPIKEGPEQLLACINQLVSLPSQTKHDLSEKVKRVKPPDFILSVEIKEAVDIISTDADGLSDPFCKIWMNNQKEKVKKTSVEKDTLHPQWNESFSFYLKGSNNDVLHLEIWDKDPSSIVDNIKQIGCTRGLRGLFLSFSEGCKNVCTCGTRDDFVGKVDIDVKDINCEGIDDWLSLKSKKNKNIVGKLHISANFAVLRPKHILDSLKRHLLLLKICLQKSLEENLNSHLKIVLWEQLVSPAASTLLFQHAIQSSLSLHEHLFCRFIVFVHLTKNQPHVNYLFLHGITKEIHDRSQQLRSTNYVLETSLENLFTEAVNNVYGLCETAITTLHSTDFTEYENTCTELECALRCIKICDDICSRPESLGSILSSEADVWFKQVDHQIKNADPETKTDFVIKTLDFILSSYSVLDKVIRKISPDNSYTQFTYGVLDSELTKNLKLHTISLAQESVNALGRVEERKMREALEIFSKIKELIEYIRETADVSSADLQLVNFREWVGSNTVEYWFRWKEEISILQIKQILSRDNLENQFIECSERLEKQSSSVMLTANVIQTELIQLWKLLSHSKYPKYDYFFLEALHSTCMNYSEFILDLIHSRNLLTNYQANGKRKLCVIANNLWSLAVFVHKIISDTVINVPSDSFDTKFSLKLTCRILCADICKESELDIVTHIKNVVVANSRKIQAKALTAYVNKIKYLFSEEAQTHMAFEIFLLFMEEIWKCVLNVVRFFTEVYKDANAISACRRFICETPCISTSLLLVLTETEKQCFIDEEGRLKPLLFTDDYKALKNELHRSVMYN